MKVDEFLGKKDKSKVKDKSIQNFKTAEKQKKLDKFLQLNFNPNTQISIKNQKKMVKLDNFNTK